MTEVACDRRLQWPAAPNSRQERFLGLKRSQFTAGLDVEVPDRHSNRSRAAVDSQLPFAGDGQPCRGMLKCAAAGHDVEIEDAGRRRAWPWSADPPGTRAVPEEAVSSIGARARRSPAARRPRPAPPGSGRPRQTPRRVRLLAIRAMLTRQSNGSRSGPSGETAISVVSPPPFFHGMRTIVRLARIMRMRPGQSIAASMRVSSAGASPSRHDRWRSPARSQPGWSRAQRREGSMLVSTGSMQAM